MSQSAEKPAFPKWPTCPSCGKAFRAPKPIPEEMKRLHWRMPQQCPHCDAVIKRSALSPSTVAAILAVVLMVLWPSYFIQTGWVGAFIALAGLAALVFFLPDRYRLVRPSDSAE